MVSMATGRVLAYAAAYAFAVWVARLMVPQGEVLSIVWPAAGAAALWAILETSRSRIAWGLALMPMVSLPIYLQQGFEAGPSLVRALTDVLTAVAAREVYRRVHGDARAGVVRPRDVYDLFWSITAATVVGTAMGMVTLTINGTPITVEDASIWFFRYWAAMGVITGCGLAMWRGEPDLSRPREALETVNRSELLTLLLVTVVGSGLVVAVADEVPAGFLLLLLVLWSASRMPVSIAAAHASVLSVGMLLCVAYVSPDVFVYDAVPLIAATATQFFVFMVAMVALLMSTAITSHSDQIAGLEQTRDEAWRLISDAPLAMALLDEHGRVTVANDALCRLLDIAPETVEAHTIASLFPGRSTSICSYLDEVRRSAGHSVSHELGLGDDTHYVLNAKLLHGEDGGDPTVLVTISDLSDRLQFERRLAYLADHDSLTGLANRREFDARLSALVGEHGHDGTDAGILLLDLDHFKDVNDTFGHIAGDDLLIEIAGILRESVDDRAVVSRLGGDEFGLLLPRTGLPETERVGRAIVERIAAHFEDKSGLHGRVSASVGAVSLSDAAHYGTDPLILADMMMYEAKSAGRNTIAVYDRAAGAVPQTGLRMAWKIRIEEALRHDRFALHLQPVLDVRTGRVTGAEALVRLVDGDRLVPPGEFIPVAESTGLAPEIDQWVIREGVRTAATLPPGLFLSLNISGRSIGDTRIHETLVAAIAEHDVDPQSIVLEVTETVAVRDINAAQVFATQLRDIGVRFAVDDFGAGYGSFVYLKTLGCDYIKIDGDFIRELETSDIDLAIVRAIVQASHDLGKLVVAEYIESPALLDIVAREGIDLAQGFHLGRPMPVEDFLQMETVVR